MTIPDEDLEKMTEAELSDLANRIQFVINRKVAMDTAASQIDQIQRDFLAGRDGEIPSDLTPGADITSWPEWAQPVGTHDSYPPGWVVRYEDKLYRNDLGFSNPIAPDKTYGKWTDVTHEVLPPEPSDDDPEN